MQYQLNDARRRRGKDCRHMLLASVTFIAFSAEAAVAAAQEVEEVIVTARKREESILEVPVATTAITEADIQRNAIVDLQQVGKFVPGFLIDRADNGNGASLYLRGVGTPKSSVAFDQAVAVVIDNVPITKGRAIFQGLFDMQQIEVLRGPQALFFGKNSTAGVISVATATPTDEREAMVRAGYEFNGKAISAEAVVSGPISDTLGVRVALRGSDMNGGFFKNISPPITGIARETDLPQETQYTGRVTLRYRPTDALDVTAKVSFDTMDTSGIHDFTQLMNCQGPGGAPQPVRGTPTASDGCKLDGVQIAAALDPAIAAGWPESNGGQPFFRYDSTFGVISADYRIGALTFSSITGYYEYATDYFSNFDFGTAQQTYGTESVDYQYLTQEFRVSSNFDTPFNFSGGLFFDRTDQDFSRTLRLFAHGPDPATGRTNSWIQAGWQDGATASAFFELIWQFAPEWELSGGSRYNHEKKTSQVSAPFASAASGLRFITTPIDDEFEDDNISSQLTLRWKPDDTFVVFGSYREGYKSGGTNISEIPFAGTTAARIHYESETAQGVELGAKMFQDEWQLSGTVYHYQFDDLQVVIWDSVTLSNRLANAGIFNTTGAELELVYAPVAVRGLRLRGSVNYNRAEYEEFLGGCYAGQTIALGCDRDFNAGTGRYNSQDYAGRIKSQAPEWTAALGTSYDFPLGSTSLMLGVNGDVRYTSEYFVQETLAPHQMQDEYYDVSGAVRLYGGDSQKWELALIGRNLTDELKVVAAQDVPSTGSGTGTATGKFADTFAMHGRPREILFQLTIRF